MLRGGRDADRRSGGDGNDRLFGGPGTGPISGESGNDFINSRDGEVDDVNCHRGIDTVIATSEDNVLGNCEN